MQVKIPVLVQAGAVGIMMMMVVARTMVKVMMTAAVVVAGRSPRSSGRLPGMRILIRTSTSLVQPTL